MPIKFQKRILKYLKNMKTCAPTGAAGIGCKWYRVQLVIGPTGFHHLLYPYFFEAIFCLELIFFLQNNNFFGRNFFSGSKFFSD